MTCVNLPGRYYCDCIEGYERMGEECVDKKVCKLTSIFDEILLTKDCFLFFLNRIYIAVYHHNLIGIKIYQSFLGPFWPLVYTSFERWSWIPFHHRFGSFQ